MENVGTSTLEKINTEKYESRKDFYKNKLRPLLQDFSLEFTYGKEEVKAQTKALEELGIYSWLFWDPKNKYTKEAFLLEN